MRLCLLLALAATMLGACSAAPSSDATPNPTTGPTAAPKTGYRCPLVTEDEVVTITGRSVTYSNGGPTECHWAFATLPGEPKDLVVAAQIWRLDMADAIARFEENYLYFATTREPEVGDGAFWRSEDGELTLRVRDQVYILGQDNLASTESETRRLVVAIAKKAAGRL